MALDLVIKPNTAPVSWKAFCKKYPPYSVALDGYVNDAPLFDQAGPRANFNHHENVDRLATRSTCAQVLIAIRQGFFDAFKDDAGPRATIYVNDCDEDVSLSWFLLKHYALIEHRFPPPAISRLVGLEDLMDATAGAYPLPISLATLQELAWVFEPYRSFRVSGSLDKKDPGEYRSVIDAVESRILLFIDGKGERTSLDTRYKKIGGGTIWSLIEEIGPHAYTGAYADGIRAYVSARPRPESRWTYTIGRMSPYIPFDIKKITAALNKAEKCKRDKWGGANTIGGSPRIGGSTLNPQQIETIVNEVLGGK